MIENANIFFPNVNSQLKKSQGSIFLRNSLIRVMPYGNIDQGQHWLRYWLLHDGTKPLSEPMLTNQSPVRSCGIHMENISQEVLKISILDTSLIIINLR